MKLEIGGGSEAKRRGGDWVNIDLCEGADLQHDLDVTPWPLADDSVDEVYSSHCLEHLSGIKPTFREICRISKLGSKVEIRVPAPGSHLEFIWTHKHCFSPIAALNMEHYFPREHWIHAKRMRLDDIIYHSSILLEEAKKELPFLRDIPDQAIMKFLPATCHECCFFYTIVENEFLP